MVDTVAEIRHPILREALLRHWRGDPLEIASVADVPAGTGMGSSGAFTVCLLKALAQARSTSITPAALAEAASEIEIDVLKEPVGKQDTYVAAHGGICAYTFHPDGSSRRRATRASAETLRQLRDNLLLFFTGGVACRVGRAQRPGRALAERRRGDAGEPARDEGDGLPIPATCCSPATWRLRGADARALGEQAPSLAGHGVGAHRHALHARSPERSDRRQARGRGRRRLPACLCPAARPTRVRRWRRRARRSLSFDFEFGGAFASEHA